MFKRGGLITNFYPCGIVPTTSRNILRLQDACGWLHAKLLVEVWLLMAKISTMESSMPSDCYYWSRLASPVGESVIGEVL